MASSLACYTENGCPEQFPNGDEGQSLEIVGGVPTWIDPVVGTVSIVTDNGDGTYTHDDGNGNLTVLDTRAASDPYDPAVDPDITLVSTNLQDVTDEIAQKNRPWRNVGAAGLGGLSTQPQNQNGVNVDVEVQHKEAILVGPNTVDGDTVDNGVFFPPFAISGRGALLLSNTNGLPLTAYQVTDAPAGDQKQVIFNRAAYSAVVDESSWSIEHRNDAGGQVGFVETASLRSFSNMNVAMANDSSIVGHQGSQRIFTMVDSTGIAPQDNVIPPAAPWAARYVHLYAQITGPVSELFVMDGAGNVTQLSSHPDVAARLMPSPLNPLGRYNFDFNTFSGIGQIKDAGAPNRTLIFDIDTGNYEVFDINGDEIASGQDDELKIGEKYAVPHKLERGAKYFAHWQKQCCDECEETQRRWDAEDEEVRAVHEERPQDYQEMSVPKSLQAQFETRKPGTKK